MNSASSAVRLRAVAPANSGAASRLGRSDNRLVPAGRADAMPSCLAEKPGGARSRGKVFNSIQVNFDGDRRQRVDAVERLRMIANQIDREGVGAQHEEGEADQDDTSHDLSLI